MVNVETGSRISIWRTVVFTWTKFGLLIDFDYRMRVTLSNTKPEVVLSHCCHHLEIEVVTPPRLALDVFRWQAACKRQQAKSFR